jgi:hypothetical protein
VLRVTGPGCRIESWIRIQMTARLARPDEPETSLNFSEFHSRPITFHIDIFVHKIFRISRESLTPSHCHVEADRTFRTIDTRTSLTFSCPTQEKGFSNHSVEGIDHCPSTSIRVHHSISTSQWPNLQQTMASPRVSSLIAAVAVAAVLVSLMGPMVRALHD